jgi:coronin-1B/1C/6
LAKPGKINEKNPMISGHSGPVLDFDFNPFHDHMIASCSEDNTIKVWGIPEGGLTENITEPLVDLHGHQRKVTLIKFHPTASNVLASTSADQAVKLWDIEKGMEINSLNDGHEQLIQDIVWDYTGQVYTTSSKDKHVRICDARTATVATIIETAHEGAKSTKLTYLGPLDKLITVGFTRQSQRQFKIWDPRNTSEELKRVDVDQAAGVIMPFFDPDTNLLYLAGKGDGNVRFYELVNENPYCYPVADHRSQTPAKGMAWVPKRGLNIMGCETARLMKLTNNSVEPLCFFVPRKSEVFQEDLYPDTISPEPSHTADEWLAGSNKPPKLMSLNPSAAGASSMVASKPKPTATAPKTIPVLQAELAQANARIKELEDRLKSAGLSIN